jgi:2,3-bisphosphoglycerate-independent phosphoglycerate mutase
LKLVYVVLDGASDGFSVSARALELSHKPSIDSLASHCLCGLMHPVGPGVAPESDVAVLSLLGYEPDRYYTGRGPLEALGAGVHFSDGWLALRANFATVDPVSLRIVDRRAGRGLSSWEARELARALDGLKLGGGRAEASFKATISHRGVLVIRHLDHRLSAMISNTDPAYERRGFISVALPSYEPYVRKAEPLVDAFEARLSAELVNEFTVKAVEVLEEHPVNKARESSGKLKANAVLLRDAGDRRPPTEPIEERFGLKFTCIAEMPVEVGIARALGMKVAEVNVEEAKSRRELLELEARLTVRELEESDAVYVHLKGPDEPGHDGDLEGKIKAIEDIDRYYFKTLLDKLNLEETLVIVTSDHSTPWSLKAHSEDPVPIMLSNPRLPEKKRSFNEMECKQGTLGVVEAGYKLLPIAIKTMKTLKGPTG